MRLFSLWIVMMLTSTAARAERVPGLSGDIFAAVADVSTSLVVAEISKVSTTKGGGELGLETRRILRGELAASATMPFIRDPNPLGVDKAQRVQGVWNNLALAPGKLLLFGLKPTAKADKRWIAIAGWPLESSTDPMIAIVEDAQALVAVRKKPKELAIAVAKALVDPRPDMRFFGRRVAGDDLHWVRRKDAVDLVSKALKHVNNSAKERGDLVDALSSGSFDGELGNDPTNRRIIAVMAEAIVAEVDEGVQGQMIDDLDATLEDGPKAALVAPLSKELREKMRKILKVRSQSGAADDRRAMRELGKVFAP